MAIDSPRIEAAVAELLAAIGEDPARPGLASTPRRVAEAYREFFAGIDEDPLAHLSDASESGCRRRRAGRTGVAARRRLPVDLRTPPAPVHRASRTSPTCRASASSGSVDCPAWSKPSAPGRNSRSAWANRSPTRSTTGLAPRGVLVVLDARHGCVTARGTRQVDSTTVTVASRGILSEPASQAAVLATIAARSADAPGTSDDPHHGRTERHPRLVQRRRPLAASRRRRSRTRPRWSRRVPTSSTSAGNRRVPGRCRLAGRRTRAGAADRARAGRPRHPGQHRHDARLDGSRRGRSGSRDHQRRVGRPRRRGHGPRGRRDRRALRRDALARRGRRAAGYRDVVAGGADRAEDPSARAHRGGRAARSASSSTRGSDSPRTPSTTGNCSADSTSSPRSATAS